MRYRRYVGVAALVVLSITLAGLAYAVYAVSMAHGHGMARGDDRAIKILAIAAVLSAVTAVFHWRRRG